MLDAQETKKVGHNWRVEITQSGRGGSILYYTEGVQTPIDFSWEFGGSVVAIIFCPAAATWDNNYPWAKGQRAMILERVGQDVIRQRAPNSKYTIESDDIILIR